MRLRVLRRVLAAREICVSGVAAQCGVSIPAATESLRALQARGLIRSRRQGVRVWYRAAADPEVEHAPALLAAVRAAIRGRVTDRGIVCAATAFTHPRRIVLVRVLKQGPAPAAVLSAHCGMSLSALCRHLHKLQRRNVAAMDERGLWRLTRPRSRLARRLVRLALREG